MLSWFVARHVFYPMVCYSVWKHTPDILPHGCFRGGYPGGGPLEGPFPCPRDGPSGPLGYLLDPFLRPGRGVLCYDQVVKWFFLTALLALQVLLLIWLVTIVQVAVRVVRGAGAEDARSDDEGSDAETGDDVHDRHRVRLHGGVHDVDDAVSAAMASDAAEKRLPKAAGLGGAGSADAIALVDDYFGPAADQHQQKQPLEQEVGVEELDLKGWSERRNRRGGASGAAAGRPTTPIIEVPTSTSTGVSLPGHHSDRKELLGRIGCEKQVE